MLHSYNKRIIRKQAQKQIARKQETREAIVYDVLPAQRKCRVKIQGVDTLIVAHYSENWEQTPEFLKPGNPVTIRHTAGNRHRIDVVGHGYVTPTKIAPGAITVGEDMITDGMAAMELGSPRMAVYIEPGTYRIGGTDYVFSGTLTMTATSTVTMGDAFTMGEFGGIVEIDAAGSSTYRFDLVVIGTDGVLDYVKGTASATDPELPAVPANHVMVCFILIPPNLTAVTNAWINSTYSDPIVSKLLVILSDDELAYLYEMSCTITVKVLDQYDNAITGTNWGIHATFVSGTGYIDGLSEKTRNTGTSSNQVIFTYERNILVDESSPMLRFELTQDVDIFNGTFILITDALGDPIF